MLFITMNSEMIKWYVVFTQNNSDTAFQKTPLPAAG